MPATQGWNAVISIIGVPTAFLDEETIRLDDDGSGATKFQIKDLFHRILDSSQSIIVKDSGTLVPENKIASIDYNFGIITLTSREDYNLTVSGNYIPTTEIAEGITFGVNTENNLIDSTTLKSCRESGGGMQDIYGKRNINVSLEKFYISSSIFKETINNQKEFFLSLLSSDHKTLQRGYFKLASDSFSFPSDDSSKENIELKCSEKDGVSRFTEFTQTA